MIGVFLSQVNERELLPGGRDIRVTEDNKLGYVELMSNWRIDRGVSEQRKSILKGFYEVRLDTVFTNNLQITSFCLYQICNTTVLIL